MGRCVPSAAAHNELLSWISGQIVQGLPQTADWGFENVVQELRFTALRCHPVTWQDFTHPRGTIGETTPTARRK
jgi:hypothetical protein